MSAPVIELAPMRWWDIAEVAQLEQELFPDPWRAEVFWAELAHVPDTRWFTVARDQVGIAGYVGLRSVAPDGDVQVIAVAPRAQRRGLGAQLLDALLAQAQERQCRQVFLEVRADNTAAQQLYRARGFTVTGRRRDYYGQGQDGVLMCRTEGAGAA